MLVWTLRMRLLLIAGAATLFAAGCAREKYAGPPADTGPLHFEQKNMPAFRRGPYNQAFFFRHNPQYRFSSAVHFAHAKAHDVPQLTPLAQADFHDPKFDAEIVQWSYDTPYIEPQMYYYGPYTGRFAWMGRRPPPPAKGTGRAIVAVLGPIPCQLLRRRQPTIGFQYLAVQRRPAMSRILWIANLAQSVDDRELADLFRPFGGVVRAEVAIDSVSGRSSKQGLVEMSTDAEADAALAALNGRQHGGRSLMVTRSGAPEAAPTFEFGSLPFEQPPGSEPGPQPGDFGDRSGRRSPPEPDPQDPDSDTKCRRRASGEPVRNWEDEGGSTRPQAHGLRDVDREKDEPTDG